MLAKVAQRLPIRRNNTAIDAVATSEIKASVKPRPAGPDFLSRSSIIIDAQQTYVSADILFLFYLLTTATSSPRQAFTGFSRPTTSSPARPMG
ncbi:hypothetical protein SAMN04488059_13711 [Devosia psychrophila]|uniref:Uncharacterized protein n=1 Tax=Devosia psychrophila TaxID=728005 RepID=A0A1I1R4S6_9HYPH|nr:hypothetical protein SAMN04488059_13711 [Devosia psychrophila]